MEVVENSPYSIDPIENLSPELFDMIFQHLSPKDLMDSSLVSRTWHEEIGNSQNMRRIKVFIYQHTQEELNDSLARLFSSQRKYRNVSVNLGTMMFDEKVERIARESNVKYKIVKFSDAKLYDSLWPVEIIKNTVRELNLCNIHCNLECNSYASFEFPNLKHLTLYKNTDIIDKLFTECHDLVTLNYTEKSDVIDTKTIENLLLNNSKLKVLGLRIVSCSEALQKIVPQCKFRLEKFSFYAYNLNNRMPQASRVLLCEFLENQKDCLNCLNIDEWCGTNALKLIFNIETLNNLSININHKGETINYIQINSNPAVNRLDVAELPETDSIVLSQVLRAVPNLIIYKTCLMRYNDMMILERHCPSLGELYVEEFSIFSLPPHSFPKLTKFKSLDINTEIVMLILAKDEVKRGHFERLILECYTRMFRDVLSAAVES